MKEYFDQLTAETPEAAREVESIRMDPYFPIMLEMFKTEIQPGAASSTPGLDRTD